MQNKNVSFELQSRVRKYLNYVMKKDVNAEQEKDILEKLNKSLKNEVKLQSQGRILFQIPFFHRNFSNQTIEKLSLTLKQLTLSPEEFLYKVSYIN